MNALANIHDPKSEDLLSGGVQVQELQEFRYALAESARSSRSAYVGMTDHGSQLEDIWAISISNSPALIH